MIHRHGISVPCSSGNKSLCRPMFQKASSSKLSRGWFSPGKIIFGNKSLEHVSELKYTLGDIRNRRSSLSILSQSIARFRSEIGFKRRHRRQPNCSSHLSVSVVCVCTFYTTCFKGKDGRKKEPFPPSPYLSRPSLFSQERKEEKGPFPASANAITPFSDQGPLHSSHMHCEAATAEAEE